MSWVFHNEVLGELRTNQPLSSPVLIVSNSSEEKGERTGEIPLMQLPERSRSLGMCLEVEQGWK